MAEERDAKADLARLESSGVFKKADLCDEALPHWIARAQAAERKERVTRRALEILADRVHRRLGGECLWTDDPCEQVPELECPECIVQGSLKRAADEFNEEVSNGE